MCAFEATVQAVVAEDAVAVAVAGLLVEDRRNLRGHLVDHDLVVVGEVDAGELVAAQDGRQRLAGRPGVIGRDVCRWVRPLG